MKRKIFTGLAVLILVGILAPLASANCTPGTVFGQRNGAGSYYYVEGFNGDVGSLVGLFWEPGVGASNNNGPYSVDQWFLQNLTYGPGWYIFGNTSSGMLGCVVDNMAMMITQNNGTSADYALLQATGTTAGVKFILPAVTFQPLPKPSVSASSRVGTDVVIDIVIPNVEAGFASRDTVGATNVVSDFALFTAQGPADPGRDVTAWTLLENNAYDGTDTARATLPISCAAGVEPVWLAVGLLGTGEIPSGHVGEAVFVNCDPLLADPDDKFDLIRERGQGQKKGKPFRDN